MRYRGDWVGLVLLVAICLGAAGLGSMATTPEIAGWYRGLAKPSWNPPAWLFGPVWTVLYLMMAVAAWMVWRSGEYRIAQRPLVWFAVQLASNIAWSWIFFGLHQPGWAFVEILALWLAIVITTIRFFERSKVAGSLMMPYLLWVSFASVLNFTLWRLNIG